eukprot:TRINITY_DN5404_c0_g1_i10.p1 TRINITY_DN5404_c0_g1~~TRINITY_DN5404_c0_g1_i10.p1  ORF type:complete len:149 (+),score=15.07 TRINITY_DN5404_c0_g1_i10:1257-1703(+)
MHSLESLGQKLEQVWGCNTQFRILGQQPPEMSRNALSIWNRVSICADFAKLKDSQHSCQLDKQLACGPIRCTSACKMSLSFPMAITSSLHRPAMCRTVLTAASCSTCESDFKSAMRAGSPLHSSTEESQAGDSVEHVWSDTDGGRRLT